MYHIVGPKSMKETAESIKARLRFLSFGPDHGSMWRWTYHDGSTLVSLAYSCNSEDSCHTDSLSPSKLVGWACLTYQEEPIPVVGVYVASEQRRLGLATRLVVPLIERIDKGSRVYAVSANWPRYPELLAQHGLRHEEWE